MRWTMVALFAVSLLVVPGCACDGGGGDDAGTASLSGSLTVFQGAGASKRTPLDADLRDAVLDQLARTSRPRSAQRAADALGRTPAPVTGAPALPALLVGGQLFGVHEPPRIRAGEVIVRTVEPMTAADALRRLKVDGLTLTHGGFASPFLQLARYTHADGTALGEGETRELVVQLASRPGVRFTEPNGVRHALAVPNDNLYPAMWHLPPINLPAAWDIERGDTNAVTVAVVDTGVVQHPDLSARLLPGYDMISDTGIANDGDGRDADATDPGHDQPNGSSSWHGTHCAGTIGASANNGSGIAGVNWNARLVPVRVLGKGGGTDFDIAAGMAWASGAQVPGVPANANPAAVVSLSLGGGGGPLQSYQDVIDEAVNRGVIFVVAGGNDNVDASGFTPCNQTNVLCIGATRFNGSRASYSNFGSRIDVMAPGGEVSEDANGDGYPDGVLSTFRDDSDGSFVYAFENGTSMATPHVAGVVSLLKARVPGVTFAQVRQVLTSTANPASQCNEGCGAGLINAHAALLQLTGTSPSGPARLTVGSTDFFFTPSQLTQQLLVTNTGGQALNVTLTAGGPEAARLGVVGGTSLSLAAGESKTVAITCNLGGLTPGTTGAATVTLASNGGNATLSVKMRVPVAEAQGAVVALVSQDSGGNWQVAASAQAPAPGFAWTLSAPPGRYFLFGMQDANGSGDYEEGDPIGLYPNNDSPTELTLTAGQVVTGLTFALAPEVSVSDMQGVVIGTACTDNSQCAPGFCGTGFPSGYCTQDCATEACPLGSRCIAGDSFSVCLASCAGPRTGQSDCRPAYVCENDGTGAGVCIPACTMDADCAPSTCNTSTGYCQ